MWSGGKEVGVIALLYFLLLLVSVSSFLESQNVVLRIDFSMFAILS